MTSDSDVSPPRHRATEGRKASRSKSRSRSPPRRRGRWDSESPSPPRRRRERSLSPSDRRTPPRFQSYFEEERRRERGYDRTADRGEREGRSREGARDGGRGESRRGRGDGERGRGRGRGRRAPEEEDLGSFEWGTREVREAEAEEKEKKKKAAANPPKPDFKLSGNLNKAENAVKGTELKYSEPTEARKPHKKYLFFVFKGDETLEPIQIHRKSYYLIGRDRNIVDIPVDHMSCSKQHAVLQYRQIVKEGDLGETILDVKPYIIDLESSNGTFVNKKRLEPARYYELFEKDLINFGHSSRDYVLLTREAAEK